MGPARGGRPPELHTLPSGGEKESQPDPSAAAFHEFRTFGPYPRAQRRMQGPIILRGHDARPRPHRAAHTRNDTLGEASVPRQRVSPSNLVTGVRSYRPTHEARGPSPRVAWASRGRTEYNTPYCPRCTTPLAPLSRAALCGYRPVRCTSQPNMPQTSAAPHFSGGRWPLPRADRAGAPSNKSSSSAAPPAFPLPRHPSISPSRNLTFIRHSACFFLPPRDFPTDDNACFWPAT